MRHSRPAGNNARDQIRARLSGAALAQVLGLEHARHSGERHKFRCPRCGSSDALHCYPDHGRDVHCFACGADAFDLVREVRGGDFRAALVFLAELCGVELHHGHRRRARRPTPTTKARKPPVDTRPPGDRPPAAEVLAVWRACLPVCDAPDLAAWLESRAIDPAIVELFDLVRAMPERGALPTWAATRRRFRLVTPLFDEAGRLASLRFRPVPGRGREARGPYDPKGPSYSARGLVMACTLARRWLAGDGEAAELVRRSGVVISEGEPDWLTWSTRWGDSPPATAPAVLGVVAGAWTAELAARVPDGTRVTIRTDTDEAGDRYAARIFDTLNPRCELWRLRPEQTP